jgi:hypothetical protein
LWKHGIIHARGYRQADQYGSKNVLIVGANASGYDITREIAEHTVQQRLQRKIYQSVRDQSRMMGRVSGEAGKHVTLVDAIVRVDFQSIYLADGSVLDDVDCIVFATGYLFRFPFCHASDPPFQSHPLTHIPPAPSSFSESSHAPLPASLPAARYPSGGLAVHNLDKHNLFYFPHPTLAIAALHYQVRCSSATGSRG